LWLPVRPALDGARNLFVPGSNNARVLEYRGAAKMAR
jgi:hypothetical protein